MSSALPELFFFYKGPQLIELHLGQFQGSQQAGEHVGAMLAGPQDQPWLTVSLFSSSRRAVARTPTPLAAYLSDRLGRQMQAKQCAIMGRGKALAAGATVKQIAAFVLAILTAKCNVTLTAHTVILAMFIGTEKLLKLAHQLLPD